MGGGGIDGWAIDAVESLSLKFYFAIAFAVCQKPIPIKPDLSDRIGE
jgi:hypothetical protein